MPARPQPNPVALDTLLPAAVREILRHEDPQRFQAWLREHVREFVSPEVREGFDPGLARALAAALGLAIWNATPLPGNRLRPRPLARPGRNDACPCGSGRKFKRCCGDAPPFPALSPELMWGHVLEALPEAERARALGEGAVPVGGIITGAEARLAADDAEGAAALLEPLFAGDLAALDTEDHELALDLLMNAYDDLGRVDDKRALIDQVIAEAPRSPLRAGAWERLAAVRMDEGDAAAAWDAFEHAQRDAPEAPALAHLEVMLLAGDGRLDEVPERARLWIRRLRRQGFEDDHDLVMWLHEVAEDPMGALDETAIRAFGGGGEQLGEWLEEIAGRAMPAYRLTGESAEGEGDEEPSSAVLEGPPGLRRLECGWHRVFPLDKPFSVNDLPFEAEDDEDVWDTEAEWCAFLAENPEAFDSLDVLDDLATAVCAHPAWGVDAFDRRVLVPVLERARAIVEGALAGVEAPRLAWVVPENRPALRALVRLALWELGVGDAARGLTLAERAVELNPHDNHGLRGAVVDEYLMAGRDEEAVALAARYPDDMLAETRYGTVLGLFRLGRVDETRAALASAVEHLPEVPRYLLEKRIREPERSSEDVAVGGEDQAWEYREHMRPVWAETPGALEWLREAAPPRRPRHPGRSRRRR